MITTYLLLSRHQIVEEKARFNHNPTNFAVAKTLLMKEKDIAAQKGDDEASKCLEWRKDWRGKNL